MHDGLRRDWTNDLSGIRRVVEDHFLQLFSTEGMRYWGDILDSVNPIVTAEMNVAFGKPVDEGEIREALAKLGGMKVPGPDGFQRVFFQNFWDIISPDVMRMAAECLSGGACPNLINLTHIVLIPKVPHPENVNQFRPISLCNYFYKVLSKIFANRLKPFLPELISPQSKCLHPWSPNPG